MLLDVNGTVANCPRKSVADLLPMKDLPGIKCHHEVEIRRGKRSHIREDNDE